MISIYSCFTETHLDNNVPNEDLFIEGFQNVPFRKDVSPHSSGLLTYIGEGLTVIQRFDLEANLDESLWIEIKQKGDSILLCNIIHHQALPFPFGIV